MDVLKLRTRALLLSAQLKDRDCKKKDAIEKERNVLEEKLQKAEKSIANLSQRHL